MDADALKALKKDFEREFPEWGSIVRTKNGRLWALPGPARSEESRLDMPSGVDADSADELKAKLTEIERERTKKAMDRAGL